jgi:hypothetical protein
MPKTTESPISKTDSLAYLDSFSGMVPVKVLCITRDDVRIRVTARRGAYIKGELLTCRHSTIVPRRAVRFRKYGTRILPFTTQFDESRKAD